ncbi:MAG: EamA family transporter, partial [Gaiellales bacterium]
QLFIAISAVLYGTQGVFAAIAYDHGASVGVLLAVRAVLFLVLALFLLNPVRRATLGGHRRSVVIACGTSIAGPALYFAAVQRMDPATVTLILFIYPALTVLGAGALGRVHLTWVSLGVTAITLLGVALAIGSPVGSIDVLGVVLTLTFACVVAGYFLVAESGLEGVDPLAWLGITVLAAAVVLIPGGLLLGGHHLPDATGWLALLGVALVSSIAACLFQTMGLMRLGSAATTLVASLEIATVVALSYLALGERPGVVSIIGAVLVIVGAALAPIAVKRKVDTGGSSVKPGAVA